MSAYLCERTLCAAVVLGKYVVEIYSFNYATAEVAAEAWQIGHFWNTRRKNVKLAETLHVCEDDLMFPPPVSVCMWCFSAST